MLIAIATYVTTSNVTIGRRYKKAIYREYTDVMSISLNHLRRSGTTPGCSVPSSGPRWATNSGLLHEQGQPSLSTHPHGSAYTEANAGVPQPNSKGQDGNYVPPGVIYMYTWEVPDRAGPGPNDPSSILWMYHSHVNDVADTNSGLIGPIIITRKGAARSMEDSAPVDVSRELIVFFNIYDENESFYLNDSISLYMSPHIPAGTDWQTLYENPVFVEGNKKHSVNGLLYSNLLNLNMTMGERVRWYVFGLGSETDLHGAHWHGQTLLSSGRRCVAMSICWFYS